MNCVECGKYTTDENEENGLYYCDRCYNRYVLGNYVNEDVSPVPESEVWYQG